MVQFGVVMLALELTGYTQDEIGVFVLKGAVPFKNLAGSAMIALNKACESKSADRRMYKRQGYHYREVTQ